MASLVAPTCLLKTNFEISLWKCMASSKGKGYLSNFFCDVPDSAQFASTLALPIDDACGQGCQFASCSSRLGTRAWTNRRTIRVWGGHGKLHISKWCYGSWPPKLSSLQIRVTFLCYHLTASVLNHVKTSVLKGVQTLGCDTVSSFNPMVCFFII